MTMPRALTLILIAVALIAGAATNASAQAREVVPLSPVPQGKIFFAEGSAVLSDDSKMVLDLVAKELLVHAAYKVVVYGHADPFEAGSSQAAWDLGLKRALAAMNYLISEGVPRERLRPDSRGHETILGVEDMRGNETYLAPMRNATTEVQLPPSRFHGSCFGMCG